MPFATDKIFNYYISLVDKTFASTPRYFFKVLSFGEDLGGASTGEDLGEASTGEDLGKASTKG